MLKKATIGGVLRSLRRGSGAIGSGVGIGALGGASIGATSSGYNAYQRAREDGGSVSQSALAGLFGAGSGAFSGAGKGALVGAGVGTAAGTVGRKALRSAVKRGLKDPNAGFIDKALASGQQAIKGEGIIGKASRFGQRQVHSVTGWVPGGAKKGTKAYGKAMDSIRDSQGVWGAKQGLEDATKAVKEHGDDAAKKALEQAKLRLSNATRAQAAELTSMPGIAQHVYKSPTQAAKDLWDLGIKDQATNQGIIGKGVLGLSAYGLGSAALTPNQKAIDSTGQTRFQNLGSQTGNLLAAATTPFMPILGSDLVARGSSAVGGLIGKGVDKLVGNTNKIGV